MLCLFFLGALLRKLHVSSLPSLAKGFAGAIMDTCISFRFVSVIAWLVPVMSD